MLEVVQTKLFKKHLKLCRKRGYDMSAIEEIVGMLQREETLPERCMDHALSGDRIGQRDCHIKSDWVLIYQVRKDVLILQLTETGSHADLSL